MTLLHDQAGARCMYYVLSLAWRLELIHPNPNPNPTLTLSLSLSLTLTLTLTRSRSRSRSRYGGEALFERGPYPHPYPLTLTPPLTPTPTRPQTRPRTRPPTLTLSRCGGGEHLRGGRSCGPGHVA